MGKRQRFTKKIKDLLGESDPPLPQQPNNAPLPSQWIYATRRSKLVTNQDSSSTCQNEDEVSAQNQSSFENDCDAALTYVLRCKRAIPATPVSVKRILQETNDVECSQTRGKRVAELTAESPLQNKNTVPLQSQPMYVTRLQSKLGTNPGSSSTPLIQNAVSVQNQCIATPISVRKILQEAKDDQCCPTRFERVAEQLTAESPLQNKVACASGAILLSSDSSASKSWSKMHHCKRSPEVQQSVPMDLSEEHVPQSNAHSFNMTEAVEKMHCYTLHDDDEGEVESSVDPTLVNVQGYRVKPEMAPILSKIINEHGDIVRNCNLKYMRVYFLEIVCSLYYNLQNTSFGKIRAREFKEMTDTVDELEQMGVNLTWFRKRLNEISSTIDFIKTYAAMKEKELETKELIGLKEKEIEQQASKLATLQNIMSTYQQKKSVMEEELLKIKAEAEKIQGMRLKASTFLKIKCLANGLI